MSHYTIHQDDDDTSRPVHTYRWSLLKDGNKIGELYSQADAETIRAALNGEDFAKDIAAIVNSYGWLLMRLAVTSDPQDTYDVCKREFDTHQHALKRLQDAFLHSRQMNAQDLIAQHVTPSQPTAEQER